ncbi:pentachlorophenol monooxygenase/3-(3-hydroxy-phenyl)propionate hydroxylase [Actinokineospora iranica]|uniref:Pentachlorophenol monooxygenase/3-(3-hydroxy-phenyl)propionate hydroxylase n=1 Tax=Actinokineospora iranica TaxID=1271860 RepID=A0A1G6Z5X0_9PSEU|nr:pentachlorophenol monooxygenase/3-(3-hydroxy-phenyl)propionate hydroxylase [Actinokineospora iranica]
MEALPGRIKVGSRAICVQRDILDVLERVGVGWQVVDAGVTWYSGRMFYREHEVSVMTFPEPPPGQFPPFVNTPQNVIEHLLEARVRAEPLIDLRYANQVVGLRQDDTGVTVAVETPDGPDSVRGTHCLAADGSRSTVRKLLNLPFPGHSFEDKFLITDIRARIEHPVPERRFYFDPAWNPGRQVLLHPQPDSVWRIDWQVPEDFDLATERANGGLDARVRKVIGDLDYELVWASLYRFHQRRVPTMRVDRVLLAGDAAHLMSPFGARGMNSGLADAENAAWKIAATRAGWAGPHLLDTYDTERGAAADENLRVTATTMRFLVPSTPAERAHRHDVLERARTDPAVRPEIDSGKLSEPFWYLDSPLTTPASAEDRAAFPRAPGHPRPPLPGVLCPDARLPDGTRLRAAFGPHFTLLAAPEAPLPALPDADRITTRRLPPEVARTLRLGRTGAALVRPDGFLAAILPARQPGEDRSTPGQPSPADTSVLNGQMRADDVGGRFSGDGRQIPGGESVAASTPHLGNTAVASLSVDKSPARQALAQSETGQPSVDHPAAEPPRASTLADEVAAAVRRASGWVVP